MSLGAPLRNLVSRAVRWLAPAGALAFFGCFVIVALAVAKEPTGDTDKPSSSSEGVRVDAQAGDGATEGAGNGKLVIEAGKTVALSCQTSAIGMDFEPFKSTKGELRLVIEFNAEAGGVDGDAERVAGSKIGVWRANVSEAGGHEASFGRITSKLCKAECLVRSTSSGGLELWAPRPVMPRDLGKDETMTLVTFDMTKLELKATTFRGQQLSILERGTCEVDDAPVPQEGETP